MSTVVFFHAHPDDEALLTGGTMARLAAGGHRVVLVTATAGEAGLAAASIAETESLAAVRTRELHDSARALGCHRVIVLGYGDSGSFATVPVPRAAARLAAILDEERADVVTGYDPAGGYGHRDHVHTHLVARKAAELAGTPILLEATVDRRALQRVLTAVAPFTRHTPDFRAPRFDHCYTAPDRITHCVPVRAFAGQKRAAMLAHLSQSTGDGGPRSLQRFLQLPLPVFRAVFGREWFVDPGLEPTRRKLTDPLDTLRAAW
jgi:LmbE family N-acetylglucosaminyl deacetylase